MCRGALLLLLPLAAASLPAQGERALQLVRQLELPDQAMAAARELGEMGEGAVPALHRALSDPRPEVRRWALWILPGVRADLASLSDPVRGHSIDWSYRTANLRIIS